MENKAKEILKKYKQDHIIELINKSNVNTKNKLINQVLNIDFEELKELYDKTFEDLYVDLEELHPIVVSLIKLLPDGYIFDGPGQDLLR